MIDFRNKVYIGSDGRKSVYDAVIRETDKAVVLFVHGYKGYKDWGAWSLIEACFLDRGFGFVKFNMSHNGGTVENVIDFPDLEAFGRNTYSYEKNDLNLIIDETDRLIRQELQLNIPVYLLGHSRGGGMAILAGAENQKVEKIVSLAGISDIGSRFPKGDDLLDWEQSGVLYVENARTRQRMPHYYPFYEDFLDHSDELDIEKAARSLTKPFLQVHGDMDLSVSISEGQRLAEWTGTDLCIIKGAEHTFGTKQPWEASELPEDMLRAMSAIIFFFEGDQ